MSVAVILVCSTHVRSYCNLRITFTSHLWSHRFLRNNRGKPRLSMLVDARLTSSITKGAISTWLATRYGQHHNFPSTAVRDRTNFLAFVSWWTVLFGIIYIVLFFHSASSGSALTSVGSHGLLCVWWLVGLWYKLISFVSLIITWIFWTAGAASITAGLGGGHNCGYVHVDTTYSRDYSFLTRLQHHWFQPPLLQPAKRSGRLVVCSINEDLS